MASYEKLKAVLKSGSIGSQLGAAAGQGKKKKGGGFFSEKWTPPHRFTDPETEERHNPDAEPIALIRGDHTIKAKTSDNKDIKFNYPFWVYYDHYNGSKGVKRRSCSCSAGLVVDLDDKGQPDFSYGSEPCLPCYYIDQEGADDYINRGRKLVFTAVVLKWFHVIKSGKKTEFKDCLSRGCPLCEKGIKRQFGRRVFWPMGPVWGEYIFEKNALFQKSCVCGGELECLGFTCPDCMGIIKDYSSVEPAKGEVELLRESDMVCPKCGEEITPVAEYECEECDNPQQLDLWSVVLKPVRIGNKYAPDLESWRVLKDREKEAIAQFKPIDFSKFLGPSSIADQSKWYGLKDPFEEDTSGSSEW